MPVTITLSHDAQDTLRKVLPTGWATKPEHILAAVAVQERLKEGDINEVSVEEFQACQQCLSFYLSERSFAAVAAVAELLKQFEITSKE